LVLLGLVVLLGHLAHLHGIPVAMALVTMKLELALEVAPEHSKELVPMEVVIRLILEVLMALFQVAEVRELEATEAMPELVSLAMVGLALQCPYIPQV
jgi:hypothetical protein